MNRRSTDALLHQYWGYTSFRPLQREAIEAVIARRDSLVVLPTGGGKSLCFQLPALLSSHRHAARRTWHAAPGTRHRTRHRSLNRQAPQWPWSFPP